MQSWKYILSREDNAALGIALASGDPDSVFMIVDIGETFTTAGDVSSNY